MSSQVTPLTFAKTLVPNDLNSFRETIGRFIGIFQLSQILGNNSLEERIMAKTFLPGIFVVGLTALQ